MSDKPFHNILSLIDNPSVDGNPEPQEADITIPSSPKTCADCSRLQVYVIQVVEAFTGKMRAQKEKTRALEKKIREIEAKQDCLSKQDRVTFPPPPDPEMTSPRMQALLKEYIENPLSIVPPNTHDKDDILKLLRLALKLEAANTAPSAPLPVPKMRKTRVRGIPKNPRPRPYFDTDHISFGPTPSGAVSTFPITPTPFPQPQPIQEKSLSDVYDAFAIQQNQLNSYPQMLQIATVPTPMFLPTLASATPFFNPIVSAGAAAYPVETKIGPSDEDRKRSNLDDIINKIASGKQLD